MGSEFVDRTKLEAQAEKLYPVPTGPRYHQIAAQVRLQNAFLAGAAAYAALLDAETTEEWGVSDRGLPGVHRKLNKGAARTVQEARDDRTLHSRRVLYGPWLPSEGGEKP